MHCQSDPDAAEAFASEAARKTGAHGRPCSNTRDITANPAPRRVMRGNKGQEHKP